MLFCGSDVFGSSGASRGDCCVLGDCEEVAWDARMGPEMEEEVVGDKVLVSEEELTSVLLGVSRGDLSVSCVSPGMVRLTERRSNHQWAAREVVLAIFVKVEIVVKIGVCAKAKQATGSRSGKK